MDKKPLFFTSSLKKTAIFAFTAGIHRQPKA
jgi:hypothetical protein